ncbi:pentatricopeptide repeat-containing protein At4g17616 [Solanum tuberosum]|uniref:Pentatricopeptide repeat-containing protein n=1 Tax=Solanum tuberosum TaxID=4113 RepID=M1D2U7_SOLTU|nr:PREDICTED: pentatricopeptide repeat-containing protein At4g17616 [Solanum tuberosum]XP_015169702.1 PREDICTED: pentatricopeptide repeat-containing protein At4g17616 [Solanum tuberosum]XP_015169703.1 PREDICTED: pentatricopeptide repeat-containing protein At4g17616 [Solanum tuberosum]XP_015169704.1 PREDICTED: pentatricopeptide repeat-containing protein At4g17616 [Solanum tuberosum]XP_015169705.1 PREDICTED: pentatricopeptide repeat-containing protein At4g17616 [Solanum tuberosum]
MACSLQKAITVCSVFRKSYSSIVAVSSNAIRLTYNSTYVPQYLGTESSISYENYKPGGVMFSRQFGSSRESETLSWGVSSDVVLLGKLESALRNHNLEEAWETYKDFKRLYGFPDPFLVDKLLTKLSYSSDSRWLKKACNMVGSILKEKREMLRTELMTKLCLSLARAQMPVQASSILRLMLDKGNLPPIDMLGMIIFHMVKTDTGMIVSSNILIEICGSSQQLTTKKSTCTELNKHNTLLFNLVLDACARFGSSSKGHQIIELMAQVGVTADAHTISIISLIHEMNGMRDELKKFKKHIDQVSVPLVSCYQQFYESLLCLHFKFNDIDAASDLVQDIYGFQVSHHEQGNETQPPKPCIVAIGSDNLRTGLKLRIFPHSLSRDSVFNVGRNQVLVKYKNGKLVLSNRALAKLIIQYKRGGRINDLSKLLCSIQKKGSVESSRMCSDVVAACICMGWLEIAHDILDDLDSEGNPLDASSYVSLLTAYCNNNKLREAEALLKQLRKSGVINASDPLLDPASMCELENESKKKLKELGSSAKGELAYHIVEEMRAEENEASFMMHDLNFSIYFFMKAHMVEDAVRAYRKMQAMKIHPTVSTFMNLLNGYSSLGMYREITILWGDIKRNMESHKNLNTRDLYEFLLLNFLRGGYFHRVMEVIGLMKENGMYLDKWMYRREFLKYHKGLYLRIKVSDAKNDVQTQRIEHVRHFRKWVGLD